MSTFMSADSENRQARLAEIRREIEAGTYETPEKLEAAVEKLLERLVASGDANFNNPR